MSMDGRNREWWGSFQVGEGETLSWRLGGAHVVAQNLGSEWQIAWGELEVEADEPWQMTRDEPFPSAPAHLERYAFRQPSGALRVTPALADRSVVSTPRVPIFVLPEEEVTLYVGSPVWLRVEVQEPWRLIRDQPIRRPSDTWSGSTPLEGELCYASRTRATLDADRLPEYFPWPISPVRVCNRSQTVLELEKLNLPAPYLSIFSAPRGRLWTQGVSMIREEDGEMARLQIDAAPPEAAGSVELLQEPRVLGEKNLLIRGFGSLLERFE